MNFLDALLLGIIQGVTEFLPISSSGHLVIFEKLFHVQTQTGVLFEVMLHLGTLLAVFLVFKNDMIRMLAEIIHIFQDLTANLHIYFKNKLNDSEQLPYRKILHNNYRTMVVMIFLSSIPTACIGYFLQGFVHHWSSSLLVAGLGLLITAVMLIVVDCWQFGNKLPRQITVRQALLLGVCQGIGVVPGISRSGITITAALLCGFRRSFAVQYSFLMSVPAVIGALFLECRNLNLEQITWSLSLSYISGMIAAAFTGYCSIRFMLNIVKKRKFRMLAIYCAVMGIIAIVCHFA